MRSTAQYAPGVFLLLTSISAIIRFGVSQNVEVISLRPFMVYTAHPISILVFGTFSIIMAYRYRFLSIPILLLAGFSYDCFASLMVFSTWYTSNQAIAFWLTVITGSYIMIYSNLGNHLRIVNPILFSTIIFVAIQSVFSILPYHLVVEPLQEIFWCSGIYYSVLKAHTLVEQKAPS